MCLPCTWNFNPISFMDTDDGNWQILSAHTRRQWCIQHQASKISNLLLLQGCNGSAATLIHPQNAHLQSASVTKIPMRPLLSTVSCAKNVNDQRARSIVLAWTFFKGVDREGAFCEAGNSCNSCLQAQKTVNCTRCTTRPKTIEGPRYFLGFLICLLVFWCKFLQFFFVYLKFCHSELENVIVCLSHFWKIWKVFGSTMNKKVKKDYEKSCKVGPKHV